ncbi:hypothetical protein IWX90DRAFT_139474 [Phyllosticta citrichinensis]|uniref:Fumarate reductase/succinate dehydrogenase flavoprotein-like C-terminal domain-containing protein n=1 Tax=Phyllosticta citrichinensis TaxID=1130410 RepID=A0ABR1XYJ7_9PEZI
MLQQKDGIDQAGRYLESSAWCSNAISRLDPLTLQPFTLANAASSQTRVPTYSGPKLPIDTLKTGKYSGASISRHAHWPAAVATVRATTRGVQVRGYRTTQLAQAKPSVRRRTRIPLVSGFRNEFTLVHITAAAGRWRNAKRIMERRDYQNAVLTADLPFLSTAQPAARNTPRALQEPLSVAANATGWILLKRLLARRESTGSHCRCTYENDYDYDERAALPVLPISASGHATASRGR